jgi:putative membrane protein
MKRWTQFALAACVAIATTACAGDRAPDSSRPADGAVGTSGARPAPADAPAPRTGNTDADFVGDMIADGQAEVDLAKMAQQKAASKPVKDFAAQMVRDHTKAAAELKTVATQAKVDLSRHHDMDHGKDVRERLSKLSGREFDREYMQAMIDDHEKAVDQVEDKAERADSDHVKQWAAKTLPTLKKHLEQAKQIHEGLDKRGS